MSPLLPVYRVRTLDEIRSVTMARTSFTLVMLVIAAGVATLLGVVGVYSVVSYVVAAQSREIGIRIALGARREDVSRHFIRFGLLLAGVGIITGLAAAIALTRLLAALLFGVHPLDPVTYSAVPGILTVSTLLASYLPARRRSIQPSL